MVWESAVHVAVNIINFAIKVLQYRYGNHPCGTVACIHTNFDRSGYGYIIFYKFLVGRDNVGCGKGAFPLSKRFFIYNSENFPDILAMNRI